MKTLNLALLSTAMVLMTINPLFGSEKTTLAYAGEAYENVLEQAEAAQKPVFVKMHAEWCGACKRMAERTLSDEEVIEFMNNNFIYMNVDVEKGEGPELAEKFGISALPTLLFLSPTGEIIHSFTGFKNTSAFMLEANQALEAFNQ